MEKSYAMVMSDGKEVGIAEINTYETTGEAVSDLGEEKARDLVNTQNKTNRMNEIRSKFNAKLTKEETRKRAMKEFGELEASEMQRIATDTANGGLEGWYEKKAAEYSSGSDALKELMITECAKKKAELVAGGVKFD